MAEGKSTLEFISVSSSDESDDPILLSCTRNKRGTKRKLATLSGDIYTANKKRRAESEDSIVSLISSLSGSSSVCDLTLEPDVELDEADDECTIINKTKSNCVRTVAPGIFGAKLVIHDPARKFGKHGRKPHDIQIDIPIRLSTIDPTHPIRIDLHPDGLFSIRDINLTKYELSQSHKLQLQIFFIGNEDCIGTSNSFEIPHDEQQDFRGDSDNGVFCPCKSTEERAEDYNLTTNRKQKVPESLTKQSRKIESMLSPWLSLYILHIYDVATMLLISFLCDPISKSTVTDIDLNIDFNGVSIDNVTVEIVDSLWKVSWNVNGIENLDALLQENQPIQVGLNTNGGDWNWACCTSCASWQHRPCIDMKYYSATNYQCWVCRLQLWSDCLNEEDDHDKLQIALSMMKDFVSYSRNGTLRYPASQEDLEEWTIDELETVALKRGIDIGASDQSKEWLIDRIINEEVFTQTPPKLSKYMASVIVELLKEDHKEHVTIRIAEFGAGHGNITIALHNKIMEKKKYNCTIDAFEIKKNRIAAARIMYKNTDINWNVQDVLTPEFILRHCENPYDLIYFNPSFEYALDTLFVALLLVKKTGSIVGLVPNDIFNGAKNRIRLTRMLRFRIEMEHQVGRHCYYPKFNRVGENKGGKPKQTADSIYVIRPVEYGDKSYNFDDKVSYRSTNAVLKGLL